MNINMKIKYEKSMIFEPGNAFIDILLAQSCADCMAFCEVFKKFGN